MSSFPLQALPAHHPKSAHILYVTEHLEVLELDQGHDSGIAHPALASVTYTQSQSVIQHFRSGRWGLLGSGLGPHK